MSNRRCFSLLAGLFVVLFAVLAGAALAPRSR
jgi:hypothetical protein